MMRADFRKPAFVLFLGLTLVLLSPALLGATYHVATDGLDSNPGTEAAPWLSLQHAVDNVDPGDEILVHAGSYPGARVENSGAPGAYITLRAADGEAVLLDAPAAGHKHDSILEVETWDSPGVVSYWAIEGFEISGAGRSGIDLRVTHHVIVRGNRVHDSGLTGIFTAFSDDLLIEANESHANGEHGIYTSNSGDRPTISGNLLHGNHAAGIHMNADLSQGGDGIISDALVERNIIFGNGVGGGSGINMDGVSNSIVRNNLIYDEHASGISLFRQDGAVCSSDNLVANNTARGFGLAPGGGIFAYLQSFGEGFTAARCTTIAVGLQVTELGWNVPTGRLRRRGLGVATTTGGENKRHEKRSSNLSSET